MRAKMTLKLPKLAVSMREGQPLYVIETEKTSTEVPSPFAGIITTSAQSGDTYPVGTPIAQIET